MQTASKILQTKHVVEKMGNYEERLQCNKNVSYVDAVS